MFKLMKYEFRKTWMTKVILLGITAAAQVLFLFGLYGDHDNALGLSVFLLTMLAIGGVLVIGLESVITLHRDMNTKQSYMLFMTPNSSYAILGAKMLECGLSILITGVFFFGLGALDISLLFVKQGELNKLYEMIQQMIHTINEKITIDASGIASFLFSILAGWIGTISTAYLADVVSSALLNGKRFNGVVSFLLFLVLDWAMGWTAQQLTASITSINQSLVWSGVISLAFSAVMYFATAQIMERKLSV